MPRTCMLVAEDVAEHFWGFSKQLSGCFSCCVAVEDAALVLGVDGKADCFVLSDFGPGVECQSVLFTDLIVAHQSLSVARAIGGERASDVACERDWDAAQDD